jgi:hypothetical protein
VSTATHTHPDASSRGHSDACVDSEDLQLRRRVAAGTVIGGFAVALIAIVHALGATPWA